MAATRNQAAAHQHQIGRRQQREHFTHAVGHIHLHRRISLAFAAALHFQLARQGGVADHVKTLGMARNQQQ